MRVTLLSCLKIIHQFSGMLPTSDTMVSSLLLLSPTPPSRRSLWSLSFLQIGNSLYPPLCSRVLILTTPLPEVNVPSFFSLFVTSVSMSLVSPFVSFRTLNFLFPPSKVPLPRLRNQLNLSYFSFLCGDQNHSPQ